MTHDEGPLGAALSMWDDALKERELGAGHWSAADLHGLVIATMRHAAGLVCQAHCSWGHNRPVYAEHAEGWMHPDDTGRPRADCNAGPIHDVIAQMEKARQ